MCSAQVIFMDVDTGEVIILGGTDFDIEEANITFTTHRLQENRHYSIAISASNAFGSAMSNANISKGIIHILSLPPTTVMCMF